MNVALSTLILFLFLIPGFLFRRFYYTGEFSKQYFKQNFTDLIFPTLIPSLLFHAVGIYLINHGPLANNYILNVEVISGLISGVANYDQVNHSLHNIYTYSDAILGYFFYISLLSGATGFLVRVLVRNLKLDRKLKIFRFQNEWHYIFSGEILDFPRVPGKAEDLDFTYVDALVKSDEGTIIYSGLLTEYVLSKEGGIDRLYLTDVKRRYLRNDEKEKPGEESKYYYMPGQFFVLPFQHVINLHITYYTVEVSSTKEVAPEKY